MTRTILISAGLALAAFTGAEGKGLAQDVNLETAREHSPSRNKAIVEAAFARWASGGNGFFDEMLAPDVVWTIEGSGPRAGTFRGREALLQAIQPFTRRLSVPVRPVSYQIWADRDHVVIHWAGAATARDGLPYRNRYAWILRMAGGKAVEVHAFLDLAAYDAVIHRVPLPSKPGD